MEIPQSVPRFPGRTIAAAVALLVVLALALAAWQLAGSRTSNPTIHSRPLPTITAGQGYVEPDATDRGPQLGQPVGSSDGTPTHGPLP